MNIIEISILVDFPIKLISFIYQCKLIKFKSWDIIFYVIIVKFLLYIYMYEKSLIYSNRIDVF